ncbi:MAG TPA: flagellar filament capping protein FliD [Bryobacteraceae bacterium]|jgi:flagellar hook-associated protein 2|nr:flagellar filament capping protein FliD [Bryobacteraceae bacterium]
MSSSATPLTFSGTSTYSADFQTTLNKAVTAASQPMVALQTTVSNLQSKQSALAALDSTFSSLQSAVALVSASALGMPSVSASSSAIQASASSTALPGTYSIQVTKMGSSTTTMSQSPTITVADPTQAGISSATTYTLSVNNTNYSITPSGTSLVSLATAINSAGDGVQATIVNVGSNSAPDYRLAVTSNSLAPDTIQLNDGSGNLLTTLSTGSNVEYSVNGQTSTLTSDSNEVTLSPGLTVQLLQQTAAPVTVTVTQDYSGLQNALSGLASAYNSAVSTLSGDRGQSGGALTGDQIVYQLTNMLQSIATYTTGSGSVSSLADLGLTLDQTGNMSFNSSTFSGANTTAIQQFLGSTTSGGGFLQIATNDLKAMTTPNTGLLQGQYNALQHEITTDNDQIAKQQVMLTNLQQSLMEQLATADAAIATLQAQTSYFQQLFTATYGNGTNSSGG